MNTTEQFRRIRDGGPKRDKYWAIGVYLTPLVLGLFVRLNGGTWYLGGFPLTTSFVTTIGALFTALTLYYYFFERSGNSKSFFARAGAFIAFVPVLIILLIPHLFLLGLL